MSTGTESFGLSRRLRSAPIDSVTSWPSGQFHGATTCITWSAKNSASGRRALTRITLSRSPRKTTHSTSLSEALGISNRGKRIASVATNSLPKQFRFARTAKSSARSARMISNTQSTSLIRKPTILTAATGIPSAVPILSCTKHRAACSGVVAGNAERRPLADTANAATRFHVRVPNTWGGFLRGRPVLERILDVRR